MVEIYERRLPLIIFGDGYQARYIHEKAEYSNEEGIMVKPILLIPTKELKEVAEIKEEEMTVTTHEGFKAMWVEYPTDYILWRNQSARDAVVDIISTFKGEHTRAMDRYKGLLEREQMRDKLEKTQQNSIIFLLKEIDRLSGDPIVVLQRMKNAQLTMETKKVEGEGEGGEGEGE